MLYGKGGLRKPLVHLTSQCSKEQRLVENRAENKQAKKEGCMDGKMYWFLKVYLKMFPLKTITIGI